MRLRIFKSNQEYLETFNWKPYYAWLPIFLDGEMFWFERLERRRENIFHRISWKYRKVDKNEPLKKKG